MKIKHYLKVLLSSVYITVRSGPLKGRKWIATTGIRFVKGDHEPYKTKAFTDNYKAGDTLFDIGAHVGYISAIAAVIGQGKGKIIAFEPRPMNAMFFRKHMHINRFDNVTLYEAAVGETDGEVLFDTGQGSATGHVSETGNISVKQISAGRMVINGEIPPPHFIKIDVEGGEKAVLKDLNEVISSFRPKLLVATHNIDCRKFVEDFLNNKNYSFEILNPGSTRGDTEIMAIPR